MSTYILTGDVLHAGRVEVEADSLEEALGKASDGDFTVLDEDGKNLGFDFCGDPDGGVEVVD